MIQRIATSGYKVSAVGSWNGAKLAKETERAQRAEKEGAGELARTLYTMAQDKNGSKQYNLEWVRAGVVV